MWLAIIVLFVWILWDSLRDGLHISDLKEEQKAMKENIATLDKALAKSNKKISDLETDLKKEKELLRQ